MLVSGMAAVQSFGAISLAAINRSSSFYPRTIAGIPPTNQPSGKANSLRPESFELGGISLESTEDQIRSMLGEPEEVRTLDNAILRGEERYLSYFKQGIRGVQLIKDAKTGQFQVYSVLAIGKEAATRDGIRVGDPSQKLLTTYGYPTSVETQGNVDTLHYYFSDGRPEMLSFTVVQDSDRITEIELSRRSSLIGLGMSTTISSKATAQSMPTSVSIRSLEIAGISTSSTEAQVRQRLGKPQSVKVDYWPCCGNVKLLDYNRARVNLIAAENGTFQVFSVSTTRAGLATRDGVQVGDSLEKVISTYGKEYRLTEKAGSQFVTYYLDQHAASLVFQIRDDRVVELAFNEQLN
jgi:hypothetical protein